MLSTYLLINIVIILFPFLFSFEKRIKYYKKFKALFASILITGTLFVIWDAFATFRGHWFFAKEHILGIHLLNLPIEEVLFFITVPYSCLFVWESINYFKKEDKIKSKFLTKKLPFIISIVLILLAMIFVEKEYTLIVLLVTAITIIIISTKTTLFERKNFYYFLLITLGLFLIFNYILTSIPIVLYDSNAITNFRILTIPIEDSLFNFSMLTIYLATYLHFKKN